MTHQLSDSNRRVRSLIDDDDADEIIDDLERDDFEMDDDMDSLFPDDDPVSGVTSPSRRTAPAPPPPPPPPAPEPRQADKDESVSRIAFYRALQGFLQAMSESAPLYLGERKRFPDEPDQALRQRVGEQCARHLKLVEHCLEINNANSQDVMLRYQRRTLARNIAEMYIDHSIEELEGMVDVAKDWSLQSKDFENAGTDSATGDNWLSIKLALFTSTLRANRNLQGLWCGHEPAEVISQLQRLAVNLSKEVAYSWSKRSQVSDREGLFLSALPHCLTIAEMAYTEVVLSQLSSEECNSADQTPALPLFDEMAEDLSVGYEDQAMDELKNRVSQMASAFVSKANCPGLSNHEHYIWRNALLEEVDRTLASAWQEAAEDLFDELREMTEQEQEAYYEANDDRMDFKRFEIRAIERLNILDRPARSIMIEFNDVTQSAKRHLAWMWGISDSLIAVRRESVPGG